MIPGWQQANEIFEAGNAGVFASRRVLSKLDTRVKVSIGKRLVNLPAQHNPSLAQ